MCASWCSLVADSLLDASTDVVAVALTATNKLIEDAAPAGGDDMSALSQRLARHALESIAQGLPMLLASWQHLNEDSQVSDPYASTKSWHEHCRGSEFSAAVWLPSRHNSCLSFHLVRN